MTDHASHRHDDIIDLLQGVKDFSVRVFPEKQELFSELAQGQSPHSLFITCADSRISPGTITQKGPGELFVLRNIGNIVPPYGEMLGGVSAAIEYAVMALKVRNIIVCGHSDCGAMKALMDPDRYGLHTMPTVGSWLRHAETARAVTRAIGDAGPEGGCDAVSTMAEQNVLLQLAHLRTHPAVAAGCAEGSLLLQGWLYDIGSGTVSVFDEHSTTPKTVDQAIAALRA
ncbi:carbonic anhydrase [Rhizosaccharibacter radicis]|uniref:Carbonic anhydrase n=1 Tax=Rhizosaccharibacter radicis TaxID=2782605 RepID=A0ABT1VVI0_9PROT|nr:carbonic anhydrase [Acetobacteraceae bacterium KSS12]